VDGYRELIDRVHDCIDRHVPHGSVVLIASKGDDRLTRLSGHRAWHFPRNAEGVYAGHYPAHSGEALTHLRQLYAKGAQYLCFPWSSHWWLEHYGELATHLAAHHELVLTHHGVCVIYALRESAAFDAFAFDALEVSSDVGRRDRDGRDGRDDDDEREPNERITLTTQAVGRAPRVLTILARFGTEQYPHAEREIAELFGRQMPAVDRDVLVVDNARPRHAVEERADGTIVIGGDNSAREFSAFDCAMDFVGSKIWSYDLVHFATSAFNRLYVAYLERFGTRLLEALMGRAVCVGHIDCYNEPVDVLTYRSQHWIRSCFFFLPPAEARALGSFVSVTEPARFFSGDPGEPFRADAPISARYREYITDWLTGGDIGQGVEWHSRFALTRETLPEFEQKTRAILNEQLLGIRLRAMGCRVIDVTWLSAMLRHRAPQDIAWNTPWREQLANRDRDVVAPAPTRVHPAEIRHARPAAAAIGNAAIGNAATGAAPAGIASIARRMAARDALSISRIAAE
jgi:hypothetical protein